MTALGVSLLVIGAVVVLIEAHVPSLGLLGGPGVIAMTVGAVLAVSGLGGGLVLGILTAVIVATLGAALITVSLRKGMAMRRRRIRTGAEGMMGHLGIVRSWSENGGTVLVDGALWRARPSAVVAHDADQQELHVGDTVVVECLNGLTLTVRRAEEWELVA
jgi:membrane-bound ClpP family serine protease